MCHHPLWTGDLSKTLLVEQTTSGAAGESPPPHSSRPTMSSQQCLLCLQVDKLRLLLLEKEDENLLLSDKYLEQVRGALRGCPSSSPLSILGPSLSSFGTSSQQASPTVGPRAGAEASSRPESAEDPRGDAGEDERGEVCGSLLSPLL